MRAGLRTPVACAPNRPTPSQDCAPGRASQLSAPIPHGTGSSGPQPATTHTLHANMPSQRDSGCKQQYSNNPPRQRLKGLNAAMEEEAHAPDHDCKEGTTRQQQRCNTPNRDWLELQTPQTLGRLHTHRQQHKTTYYFQKNNILYQ